MPWMSTTDWVLKRYCNSPVESAVFHGSRHEEKFALTHDVVFREHDVLMFEVEFIFYPSPNSFEEERRR